LTYQGDALEGLCRGLLNLLSGSDRAGKRDLLDVWVNDESWANFVIATEDLHQAGWEDLLSHLDHLQGSISDFVSLYN
jgi:hypothetical protein